MARRAEAAPPVTAAFNPTVRGVAYTFYVPGLRSWAQPKVFKTNPTITPADVRIKKDKGLLSPLGKTPIVDPFGSTMVRVDLTSLEMSADNIVIVFHDVAGQEWIDTGILIQPVAK